MIIILFILLIILLILIFSNYQKEYFTSYDGMGKDNSYSFNGPYDYSQDPALEYANDSNQGMGSDKVYSFNGPYNYDQNPLL
jgi:ABC-type cobalt transport system substrate-binding protein